MTHYIGSCSFKYSFRAVILSYWVRSLVVLGCVSASFIPAKAIPVKQAWSKLSVIPVFIVVNEKQHPYVIKQPATVLQQAHLEMTGFLEMGAATEELNRLQAELPKDRKFKLMVMTLNNVLNMLNTANEKKQKIDQLVTKLDLVGPLGDKELALRYMKRQGVSSSSLASGIEIPVFFSEPSLILNSEDRSKKNLLFLQHSDLLKVADQLPEDKRSELKVKVMELSDVIKVIVSEKKDVYAFFPTPAFNDINETLESKKTR